MGSVDDNYKCPLCGRRGNGGYAMDGIDYPICTEGDYSCLGLQVLDNWLNRWGGWGGSFLTWQAAWDWALANAKDNRGYGLCFGINRTIQF